MPETAPHTPLIIYMIFSFIGLFAIFFWAIYSTCVGLPKLIRYFRGFR